MDQQQTDEFVMYGILPEHAARGKVKLEDFRALVQDYLQLGPIYSILIRILETEHNVEVVDKMKIDIPTIYRCFSSVTFLREVPPFINNRVTKQNIRIIKAGLHVFSEQLLTMQDIKDASLVFQLKEMEHMTEGLPCEIPIINSMLWKINKTISVKVLEEWIKRCANFLEIKGVLQPFEFLFLVCNTVDRRNFYDKIPKATLDIARDPKFRLFHVDSTGFTTLKNPDTKIQHYMNYQYNVEKCTFQGRSANDRNEYYMQKRQQRFDGFLKKQNTNKNEFKKLLRDPELYVEIKSKIKNAQQLLNHSKLNGKMLRAQLKDELGFDYVEESKSPQLSHQNTIDKVREQPTYQKMQSQRPQSAVFNQIKSEVGVHRQMAQDQCFMTEYMGHKIGRTPSAASVGTQRTLQKGINTKSKTSRILSGRLPVRPATGKRTVSTIDYKKVNAESILDEELTNYERVSELGVNDEEKFVFYGSSNSTQRQFTINLPWSASTRKH